MTTLLENYLQTPPRRQHTVTGESKRLLENYLPTPLQVDLLETALTGCLTGRQLPEGIPKDNTPQRQGIQMKLLEKID